MPMHEANLSVAPPATLAYESLVDPAPVRQSRWGVASCALCAIVLLYTVVCAIGMTRATGWDGLAWLIFGFYGNWIGCGVAAVLGLIGVLQRRRGRRLAVHGLWLSFFLAGAPIAILWLLSRLSSGGGL
jgi:hypothetical protein